MTLVERLHHFEENQLKQGDEYGAEVLCHAANHLETIGIRFTAFMKEYWQFEGSDVPSTWHPLKDAIENSQK